MIHLVLHAIALILGIIGICAAFKNHNESGIANLYSLHSWLGIGVIVLYGIQVNHWNLGLNLKNYPENIIFLQGLNTIFIFFFYYIVHMIMKVDICVYRLCLSLWCHTAIVSADYIPSIWDIRVCACTVQTLNWKYSLSLCSNEYAHSLLRKMLDDQKFC